MYKINAIVLEFYLHYHDRMYIHSCRVRLNPYGHQIREEKRVGLSHGDPIKGTARSTTCKVDL